MHYGTDFKHKLRSERNHSPGLSGLPLFAKALAVIAGIMLITAVIGISPDSSASISAHNDNESDHGKSWVKEGIPLPGLPLKATEPNSVSIDNPIKPDTTALLVPEKQLEVTEIASLSTESDLESIPWIISEVKKGDSPSRIFSRHNIHSDLLKVIALGDANTALKRIRPGQIIKLNIDHQGLVDLLYEPSKTERLLVHRADAVDVLQVDLDMTA